MREAVGVRPPLRTADHVVARAEDPGHGRRAARGCGDFFGDEPCLLVNGDVFFRFDLRAADARAGSARGAPVVLGLIPNPDPRRYSPRDAGRPRPHPVDRGAAAAARRARRGSSRASTCSIPRLLDRLPPGPSDSVRDLYLPMLAEGERVEGVRLRGAWYDLGAPPLYLASQLAMLRKRVPGRTRGRLVGPGAAVEPGARVSRSVIGRASVIEEEAVVEDSVFWEGSRIGRGCVVRAFDRGRRGRCRRGARVENAIVMPGAARTDLSAGALGPMRHHVPKQARAAVAPRRRVIRSAEDGIRRRGAPLPSLAVGRPRRGGAHQPAGRRRLHAPLLPRAARGARPAWSRSTRSRSTARARPSSSCTGCSRGGACRCRASCDVDGARASCWQEDLGDVTLQAALQEHERFAAARLLSPGARPAGPPAARGRAGTPGSVLLPDRVRLREAVVGAALLLEALPGGVPRLRPHGRGPGAGRGRVPPAGVGDRVLAARAVPPRLPQPQPDAARRPAGLDRLPGRAHGPRHLRPGVAAARLLRGPARGVRGRAASRSSASARCRASRATRSSGASS